MSDRRDLRTHFLSAGAEGLGLVRRPDVQRADIVMRELQEGDEPQLAAQQVLWSGVLGMLAAHGRLAYDEPNYDQPEFSTDYLALDEEDVDLLTGNFRPVPCIKIVSHEHRFIWGYMANQSRKLLPKTEEERQQRLAEALHETYAAKPSSMPYVDIEAYNVSYVRGRRRVIDRGDPLGGAYVPAVVLGKQPLAIFPETPLPNCLPHSHKPHWMRIGPPVTADIHIPSHNPRLQSTAEYNSWLDTTIAGHQQRREAQLDAIRDVAGILHAAILKDLPLQERYERRQQQAVERKRREALKRQ